MTRNNQASVSQLVRLFRSTLDEIGCDAASDLVESMSFVVHRAMTGSSRDYHGIGHVFSVAQGLPALGRLAAIYHDTVYCQVDHGFNPDIWQKISKTGKLRDDGRFEIAPRLDEKTEDVAHLFGFVPGQEVGIHDGLNEFLSAVLAVRELSEFLNRKETWIVAACIEATIPFRGRNDSGEWPAAVLEQRLLSLAANRHLKMSAKEAVDAVRLAVRVANSDVQSFAQIDVGAFLDDTWKLLPESNPEFHNSGAYSIHKYLEAMCKTEAFLSHLDPELIFQRHQGTPSDRTFAAMRDRAQSNLEKACEYIRAKIVTISLLEALAELTGGDAPVSYFTGAAESGEVMAYGLLPDTEALPIEGLPQVDAMVLHVLSVGRITQTRFDTTKSSLSAYLYETLGTSGINEQAERFRLVNAGKKDWRWYLEGFPQEQMSAIARAVAELAVERRSKLLKIAEKKGAKLRKAA